MCGGLAVELALPKGHCSPEPLGTPESLITVACGAKSPSASIHTGPKWRDNRTNIRGSSYTGNGGRGFPSACASAETLAPPRTPLGNALPRSSSYSVGAMGKGGLLAAAVESGRRSVPAAAAGKCSLGTVTRLMDCLASDLRETEGSHLHPPHPAASQKVLSVSLTCGSLSTLQHLYHEGISWESFLFVDCVLLLAHVFSPVSRPSILFK